MSAIPGLKKKLKSVRAARKLSEAMKTVSAAKFAKLSAVYKNYSLYANRYRLYFEGSGNVPFDDTAQAVVVMGSDRGFCGGFNNEIMLFLKEKVLNGRIPSRLIVCGSEMIKLVKEEGISPEKTFSFGDIPSFSECEPLLEYLSEIARDRTDYPVKIVRPFYKNTMSQVPDEEIIYLNPTVPATEDEENLWIPDKKTVMTAILEKGIRALVFGAILETALGAQASTLITMRSAYDTASEYSEELESEIHRQRQRDVTSDVIETASERGNKGDETSD